MADDEPKPLAYIPETVLKKRKDNEGWAIRRREKLEARRQRYTEDKRLIFKRAEEFIKEFRGKELDLVRMKSRAKLKRPLHIKPDAKLLFVIRIGGTNDMHEKTRKILYSLRLRHIFNGVFVRANERTLDMLQKVQPYVTYGYPNLKSVKELVYKKGYGKVDKQRVPLTDNNIIEQALGKCNIICIEDIVHEIATVGSHFKEVINFLWPFKLKKPQGVRQMKRLQYKAGGESGNREDKINELISKLN